MIIENCKTCGVYTLQHVHMFDASVHISEDTILISFPKFDTSLIPVQIEDEDPFQFEAEISFYTPLKGVVTCICEVVAHRTKILSGGNIYSGRCKILSIETIRERRNDLKIKVSIPVLVHITDSQGKSQDVNGRTKDLSAGGVYLTCKYALNIDDTFEVTFLHKKIPICVRAMILRKDEYDNGLFGYGCKFLSLRGGEERMLRHYVFDQQKRFPEIV